MANVIRHTAVWTGAPGLPGYSQFYQSYVGDIATAAQLGHDDVDALFEELTVNLPEEVTVTVNPIYQVLDIASGEMVAEDTVGTPAGATTGTHVGGWNAQFGVMVEWITGVFVGGSRLRGRTYLVPLGPIADVDGTLPSATIAAVEAAADLVAESGHGFVVWHRPVAGVGGLVALITGRSVRDHAAILRSRMV